MAKLEAKDRMEAAISGQLRLDPLDLAEVVELATGSKELAQAYFEQAVMATWKTPGS